MKERITIATGERGCLVADTLHADLTYYANGSVNTEWAATEIFRGVTEGDVTRYAITKREPLRAEHEAFRNVLLGEHGDIVTLWQAAQTVAVAEAVLASAARGVAVTPTRLFAPAHASQPTSRSHPRGRAILQIDAA